MNETAWQSQVIELARLLGWRVAHFRAARTVHGWRTPVQADGAGWPDLVLVRASRLLFVELKNETRKLAPEQLDWLVRLANTGAEVYVWRPVDLEDAARILRAREAVPA